LDGSLLVAIHPRLATYSREQGLQIGVVSQKDWAVEPRPFTPKRDDDRYRYTQETYQEHIAGLYRAYQQPVYDQKTDKERRSLAQEMAYAFARMEQRFDMPSGLLDQAARFIIAGHDLGKLGKEWQAWSHRWQETIGQKTPAAKMLAHTDYDGSDEQYKLQKKLGSRPSHAAESAFGLIDLSWDLFGKIKALYRAVNTAIIRHHGAAHRGYVTDFKVDPHGPTALKEAFAGVGLTTPFLENVLWEFAEGQDLAGEMIEVDKESQVLLYFLLVRLLRLADQRSQIK
jgi:hypothetical protein